MNVIETAVYTLDELSDKAKEKARDWYREGNCDDSFWYEYIIDDCKTLLGKIGFQVDDIRFSGFACQGDGASFLGSYRYACGGLKALIAYAPNETKLHGIAKELNVLQRKYFYQLSASITGKRYDSYVHEYSTSVEVEHDKCLDVSDKTREAIKEIVVNINRWIYRQLENEWDYQNSDEAVDDNIIGNEYTFTETGKRFG